MYSINASVDGGPGTVDDHFLFSEVREVSKDVVLVVQNIGSVMVSCSPFSSCVAG